MVERNRMLDPILISSIEPTWFVKANTIVICVYNLKVVVTCMYVMNSGGEIRIFSNSTLLEIVSLIAVSKWWKFNHIQYDRNKTNYMYQLLS